MPLRVEPGGIITGTIDGPMPPSGQYQHELMLRVTDAGPDGLGRGDPDPSDQVVARAVHVRYEADWTIYRLGSLLPKDYSFSVTNDRFMTIASPKLLAMTPSEALQHVENLVRHLVAVMHAYSPNTRWGFEAQQVHELLASGRQSVLVRHQITVSEKDGVAKLNEYLKDTEPRASILVSLARTSGEVSEALSLLQDPEPGWAAVYNVLKFLRNSPVTTGVRSKISLHLRTANYHRHLGESDRQVLPKNPPSLFDARTFAFGLLRTWLELRVTKYLAKP